MNQPMRKIEVDEATAQALERRAAEMGTSVAAVVSELALLDRPTPVSPAELAELDRRWAKIKAGEATIPHEKVASWLETWGDRNSEPWQGE